jgi:DNA polymerase delta subunit 3
MLYDFHTKENTKTPNSVHATYLLAGRKRSLEHTNGANGQDGDDTIMQSSPYMSSMPEPEAEQPSGASIPKTSIILVREEELDCTCGLPNMKEKAN